MRKNSLFNKTRLQIAAWYAAGTGLILILMSSYLYFMVKDNYSSAIDREVAALAGTLHDALEPKLQQPGIIDKSIDQEVIPNLCITGQKCTAEPDRHTLGVTQRDVYYLRFYNLQQQVIAQSGIQPIRNSPPSLNEPWRAIYDIEGNHYQRFSTDLTTADGRPWGYLQVGRSMKEFDEQLTKLQLRMALILPILTLFIAMLSWWIAGRTMKPIYSSYQKMEQFTADAAHELRTPLMALQATVELMQYYKAEEYRQQQESLVVIDRQTQRLIQLTQDLLMLSRLDAPTDALQLEPCCLNQVLPPLVKSLQILSQDVELTILLKTPESLLVRIDRIHLERLLTNLVTNAIEHTSADGAITITLDRVGNYTILEVTDTGVGISPAAQEHVFDRFYRVSTDRLWRKRNYQGQQSGGTGLGLAIVKSIVSNYGGIVLVKSQLQKGSTFTVKLPLYNLKNKHWLT